MIKLNQRKLLRSDHLDERKLTLNRIVAVLWPFYLNSPSNHYWWSVVLSSVIGHNVLQLLISLKRHQVTS